MEPTFLAVDDGSAFYDSPARTVRELFSHHDLDVTWSRYEAGERGPGLHVHHEHVDGFFVVEGALRFRVGAEGRPVDARAGTLVLVPPNLAHGFDNESGGTVRWLNFHAPSTGFVPSMRGEDVTWDSHDVPADGGRSTDDAIVVTLDGGERFDRGNGIVAILGDLPQLSVLTLRIDPGWTVPPHTHDDEVDSFYVLEGEVELTAGDATVSVGPGHWLSAPPGARHGFRNASDEPVALLNLHAPDRGFVAAVRGHS